MEEEEKRITRDLQIDPHRDHQRRATKWQRLGWIVMALLVVASLVGLFGPGLMGEATAGDRSAPIWLEYTRFGRVFAESTTLGVHLGPEVMHDGEARFWLSREYLDKFQINGITPEPDHTELSSDRVTFVFETSSSAPPQPLQVAFHLESEQTGNVTGRAGLDGDRSIGFAQFFYP